MIQEYKRIGRIVILDMTDPETVDLLNDSMNRAGVNDVRFHTMDPDWFEALVIEMTPYLYEVAPLCEQGGCDVYITFGRLPRNIAGYYLGRLKIVVASDRLTPPDVIGVVMHEIGHHLQRIGVLPMKMPQPRKGGGSIPASELVAEGFMLRYVIPRVGWTADWDLDRRMALARRIEKLMKS